jgi:TolB-like protein/DNA-binding winged helix-turn-helix (wHTH) protein
MDALVEGERLGFGNFRLEPRSKRLFRRDAAGDWVAVPLGSRALEILQVLLNAPGFVVSKDAIMDAVWPGLAVEPNNLTVQIAALRRVLDEGRNGESCIQTVPGRGYRLVLGVTAATPEAPPDPAPLSAALSQPGARPVWFARHWRIAAASAVSAVTLLLVAIWQADWLSTAPAPHRLSLVVLPFTSLSADPKDDYLADAVTDDLTSDLSHIPGAFVIASASAYSYRGKSLDIRKIGSELGVRFAVLGSVRRLGETLHVDVQVDSTETGAQLWSDRFDQPLSDLATGQEAAIIRMRSALNITLTDIAAARSLREHPSNPDSFDLILRARALRNRPMTAAINTEALRLLELALARDPDSVVALTRAVYALTEAVLYNTLPRGIALDRAARYLDRAASIEPNSELVLQARAQLLDYQSRIPELAELSQRLITNFPNSQDSYFHGAVAMKRLGQCEEALPLFAASARLDPRSPFLANRYWNLAYCSVLLGRDSDAIAWAKRADGFEDGLPRQWHVSLLLYQAAAYARTGDLDAAHRAVAEAVRIDPFVTVRLQFSYWPGSPAMVAQTRRLHDAMRLAGLRDHAEPDADFGVPSDNMLHAELAARTPTSVPGATTIRTADLAVLLQEKPLVIDTMLYDRRVSIAGAVGLDGSGVGGSLSDPVQARLGSKLHTLTGGDLERQIVATGLNSEHFDSRNLALRLVALGYTHVFWYRGGREAWETEQLPKSEADIQNW